MAHDDTGEAPALPDGWVWTTLEEIANVTQRRVTPEEHPDLRFIGMEHIEAHTMRLLDTVSASDMKSAAESFEPGDVLYGRLRPYLNKVYSPDFVGLCSAEFIVFRQAPYLDHRYLQYFLNSWEFVTFASHLNEGDRPRVNFSQLGRYPFPLSPLPEQRRIVAEIETQFTRLEAGVAALKRAQAKLRRYKAAVLQAACEGRLVPTEADLARAEGRDYEPADVLLQRILAERRTRWQVEHPDKRYEEPTPRGKSDLPDLPEGWVWASVDQATHRVTKGASPAWQGYGYQEAGVLFLRSQNIGWGHLDLKSVVYVSEEYNVKEARSVIESEDVLLNIVGASIGRAAKATSYVTGGNLNQAVAILRMVRPLVSPDLVVLYLISPDAQRSIGRKVVDVARANLSLADIRGLAFPLPPLVEQLRTVAEVERRLSVVGELEKQVEVALRRAERLRQAILSQAYRGKLVEQDANDEPANVLLA